MILSVIPQKKILRLGKVSQMVEIRKNGTVRNFGIFENQKSSVRTIRFLSERLYAKIYCLKSGLLSN